MRITFIATAIDVERGGGSHRNIVAIIRALRTAGHVVEVTTIFSARNRLPKDISVTEEHGEGLSFRAIERFVAHVLDSAHTDLLFVYGHTLVWGAGRYRMCGATPVVVYLDNYLDSMPGTIRARSITSRVLHFVWERTSGKRRIRAVDRFIAVSPYLRDVYVRSGFPAGRTGVVPNFFEWDTKCPAPIGGNRILYAGRLTLEKGTDTLLRALERLPREVEWRARIIGDGPLRELVEKSASGDSRIEYVSWMSEHELADEYASAGIFVHPARWPEPFGRTILEAMHAGLPVIIPEAGAAVALAGDAGVTFKNGDPLSLSQALVSLLTDASRRKELGQRGPARARLFSKEAVVPGLLQMLESVHNSVHAV